MKKLKLVLGLVVLLSCNKSNTQKFSFELLESNNENYREYLHKEKTLGKIKIYNLSEDIIVYSSDKRYFGIWYVNNNRLDFKNFDEHNSPRKIHIKKNASEIIYFHIPPDFDTLYLPLKWSRGSNMSFSNIKFIKNTENKLIQHSVLSEFSNENIVEYNSIPYLERE